MAITQTSYEILTSLEKVQHIAGTEYTYEYTFYKYDISGNIVDLDLTGGTVTFRLSPLGDPQSASIDRECTITDTNVAEITTTYDETKDLSGTYIQQATVEDATGGTFTPGQGLVVILPRNS